MLFAGVIVGVPNCITSTHTHSFTKGGSAMQGSGKQEKAKESEITEARCERCWHDAVSVSAALLSALSGRQTLHGVAAGIFSFPVSPAVLPSHLLCDSLQDSHPSSSSPMLFPPRLLLIKVLFLPQHLAFLAHLYPSLSPAFIPSLSSSPTFPCFCQVKSRRDFKQRLKQ